MFDVAPPDLAFGGLAAGGEVKRARKRVTSIKKSAAE